MIDNQISLSTRRFWQTERSEQALIDADAAMIICLDHQRVSALFAFGRSPARALNEEQVTAGRMLVEQLGITITSSYLQMERLAAERRLQDQTKLSMMGMVASAVAHEVKNPLSSIKTISTLLAEELGPDSQYNEELTLIRGEVDRLSETVTQMLGFVRPGTQRGDTVSLESFLKGAVRLMQHMAKKRGVSLTFECADPVPEISSASGNVRDIFLNLIGNAIDAAETADAAGGQVAVRIQTTQTEVNVSIEDNGPGISPADVPRLFEPFYTTKATGTGLGLAIAKERADEVGATIACRPGNARGTVFTVTFPIKDEPK
jgi:signal transduction histidine kinase